MTFGRLQTGIHAHLLLEVSLRPALRQRNWTLQTQIHRTKLVVSAFTGCDGVFRRAFLSWRYGEQ